MSMISYRVYNIDYDTDGEVIDNLPKELIIELEEDDDPKYDLADKISDKTNWCIFGCKYEKLDRGNSTSTIEENYNDF